MKNPRKERTKPHYIRCPRDGTRVYFPKGIVERRCPTCWGWIDNPTYSTILDKAGREYGVMPFGSKGVMIGRTGDEKLKYVSPLVPGMRTAKVENPSKAYHLKRITQMARATAEEQDPEMKFYFGGQMTVEVDNARVSRATQTEIEGALRRGVKGTKRNPGYPITGYFTSGEGSPPPYPGHWTTPRPELW